MPGNINKAYQWTINTCNAPDVGYSQPNRNQITVNGITYYDCSSLMWYALKAGGWNVAAAYTGPAACFRTWEMAATCERLGFNILNARTEIWKPGDILVDDWRSIYDQHTEMVYEGPPANQASYGKTMGAHANESNGRPIPLADQVSINNYYTTPSDWWNQFNHIIRWGDGGAGGYGASIYVVSAILGNWLRESTINPGRYEGDIVIPIADPNVYGGYGLGQWTNNPLTGNTRRTKFANWMVEHGYPYDSGPGQIEFFLNEKEYIDPETHETKTTGQWQAAGIYGSKWAGIYDTFDDFFYSDSTDLRALTEAFLNCWEIGNTGLDIRYAGAQTVFEWLRSAGSMHPLDWIVANRALTSDESKNNAIIIWDLLSSGGGGGGKLPYHKYKKMPVWMMINHNLF